MTTIDEVSSPNMDEFFDFSEAGMPSQNMNLDFSSSGPYDIDLAFAEPEDDENSFSCLQHFSAEDFTDFPRWIDGLNFPNKPCAYCERMRIHCKVIKEGVRKGSCTSCVALARSCSLTHPDPTPLNGLEMSGRYTSDENGQDIHDPCGYCKARGLQCHAVYEGPRSGSCANCIAFACPCSLNSGTGQDVLDSANIECPSPLERSRSDSNLGSLNSSSENLLAAPKVGARFSRQSLRILRNWLSSHHSHPYPSEEEKESLMRQTGLNKTQVTNWLANARRRGKIRPPRSTSPAVRGAMDIPRRSTPALESMNPLERWKHSPPEHEPASITAITKAVSSSTYSSGHESPFTSYDHTDDGSSRSLCNLSSTSSLGTSHSSGGSFVSAFSHKSQGSFGSFGNRGRRRRRRAAPKPVKITATSQPAKTYQCTFCTETFKTKHDWQRHEKSLHLSLERWICCPNGPSQYSTEYGSNRCVFCGIANPTAEHAETHNYSSCADRTLEERTFYRKDHLRQHLNLVHDAKFQAWAMEEWKVATPEIRSRCGFCGIVMDSWSFRVDHLAEHFKGGKSMADWKGDWGFEPQILDIVENGLPPYLIHDERNTMDPFEASKDSPEEEKTLEDLVKIGVSDYINEQVLKGGVPTDQDLLVEARRIIAKSDSFSAHDPEISWFRDLILLWGVPEEIIDPSERPEKDLPWASKLEILAANIPAKYSDLSTISCPKERALMAFVQSKTALGLTPTDRELQTECCRILEDIEVTTNYKCKGAVGWFRYLITSSGCWLRLFRRRASLPRSSDIGLEHCRSSDQTTIDYSVLNLDRLEGELKDWCRAQLSAGNRPSDDEIQRQARLIVYRNDDPWNQTAMDDPALLHLWKRQNGLAPKDTHTDTTLDLPTLSEAVEAESPKPLHWDLEQTGVSLHPSQNSSGRNSAAAMIASAQPREAALDDRLRLLVQNQPSTNTNPTQPLKYFLNDVNCYGRLVRELSRFVRGCLSPNNPAQHIPSDEEIQNHARWIIYDDDDPWNQTAADNAEWLIRFKRDVGLASPGPGLPLESLSWQVSGGGSGFSPPYVLPGKPEKVTIGADDEEVEFTMKGKKYPVSADTARKFVKGLRYKKPGVVFCSREMEAGLSKLVEEQKLLGKIPSDEELRVKAREILGVERTAADDDQLLEKFKQLHNLPSTTPLPRDMEGVEQHQSGSSVSPLEEGNSTQLGNLIPPLPFTDGPSVPFSDTLEADFDAELFGAMDMDMDMDTDLSKFCLSTSQDLGTGFNLFGSPTMDMNLRYSPASSNHSAQNLSPAASSFTQPTQAKHSPSKGEGIASDYAEMFKVNTATASPLRRKASAKMAEKATWEAPAKLQDERFCPLERVGGKTVGHNWPLLSRRES